MKSEIEPFLRPCSFCGSEGHFTTKMFRWRVECVNRFDSCSMNARTHHCDEKREAALLWNKRTERL